MPRGAIQPSSDARFWTWSRRADRSLTWGALRLRLQHTFDWTELAEAQRVQQAGEHTGKIAITILRGSP